METWFKDAKRITSLEAEVCFLFQDNFYYGPDSYSAVAERKDVEPLHSPSIIRRIPSMVRTVEVLGNEEKLADYYREVISIAQKHQKTFNEIRQYFWLRFWLWNTEEDVHIPFPWYDTYSEINQFLECITAKTNGQVFWDIDQGWELELHALDDELFARLRNPDDDETPMLLQFPRNALLTQIHALQTRTESIFQFLSAAIGHDAWINRVEWPEFHVTQKNGTQETHTWWKFWKSRTTP